MIRATHARSSLRAIQAIATLARSLTLAHEEEERVPHLLDEIDNLLNLVLSEGDETDAFAARLNQLATNYGYHHARDVFLHHVS